MARKTEAYVDTSAFIAFLDVSDTHHSLFRRLFSDPPKLVTSALVIAEGHGWFLKRYDRYRAMQFLGLFDVMPMLSVSNPTAGERKGAIEVLKRFSDQDLTLVDAIGLHIMAARKLTNCWSTDFHLGLTGARLAIHT